MTRLVSRRCAWLSLGLLAIGPVRAQADDAAPVFTPPGLHLSIHPLDQRGRLYGRDQGSAQWHVSQWNNPGGNLADVDRGRMSGGNMDVEVSPGPPIAYDIRQRGASLACEHDGMPLEFDGLIGTNTSRNNPGFPTAEAAARGVPLSRLRSLRQELRLTVAAARRAAVDRLCPVSKAVSLACVVFSNTNDHTTLFYQVLLFAFQSRPQPAWWARGRDGRFGYNETAARLGSFMAGGAATLHLNVDLLPDVLRTIRTNEVGMDSDPRDWIISGAYFGNELYGSVDLATRWSGYGLTASVQ